MSADTREQAQPRTLRSFVDRGPLTALAVILLPTLLVAVPLGFLARCIWDGLQEGWHWPERQEPRS